jgi:hypothetical protein
MKRVHTSLTGSREDAGEDTGSFYERGPGRPRHMAAAGQMTTQPVNEPGAVPWSAYWRPLVPVA